MRATGQATSNKGQRQSTMSMTHESTMINDRVVKVLSNWTNDHGHKCNF